MLRGLPSPETRPPFFTVSAYATPNVDGIHTLVDSEAYTNNTLLFIVSKLLLVLLLFVNVQRLRNG